MPARSKPPRAPLTREAVVLAAVEMADERGLEALSMRKLAEVLGVEAMSLYNHVANKDDLLDGMVDAVIAEVALPQIGGDWKAELRKRAVSAHEMLTRHPWASMLVISRMNTGPAMLRYVEATIGCLREARFSIAQTDHAWNALDCHIYGFTLLKANFPIDPEEYASAAARYLPRLPAETYPHMHAMTVEVAEGRHSGVNDFSFGLDLILDGLERMRKRNPR